MHASGELDIEGYVEDQPKFGSRGGDPMFKVIPKGTNITGITLYKDMDGDFITGFKIHHTTGSVSREPTRAGCNLSEYFELNDDEHITKVIFCTKFNGRFHKDTVFGIEMYTQNGEKMHYGNCSGYKYIHTGVRLVGFAGNIGHGVDRLWCIWDETRKPSKFIPAVIKIKTKCFVLS